MFSKQSVQAQRGTVGSSSQRASWNDLQKEIMMQQLHNFPRERRGGWSKDTWVKITEVMKGMFPSSNFTTQQLKQQERDLHKLYNKVKDILMQPGFTWDAKNCMLQASNDSWRLLSETNGRLLWSRRTIPYYAVLDALYKDRDVGAQVESNSTPIQIVAREDAGDIASPKANEQATPSSPGFCTSDRSLLIPQHDYDFGIVFSPPYIFSPLLTSDLNPQPTHDYNTIANSNLSEIFHQPIPTKISDAPAGFSSEGLINHPNPMYVVPSFNNCENKSPSNNDTGTRHDPSLSAPLNPDHASNSQQPSKQNSFLNHPRENPVRKVRGKKTQTKKIWAKSNFSMMRCMSMLNELQEFEEYDMECVVEIFRDDLYRQAFVSMKRRHKVSWLQKKIGKGK